MLEAQKQSGGDQSVIVQASGDVTINSGLSYQDVRQISADVFSQNFFNLSQEAGDLAAKRAIEATEAFLAEQKKRGKASVDAAKDPGFQSALFEVQKEYAKTGDRDLVSLLVEVLSDRAEKNERDVCQITLDEALKVAPKLTTAQINSLSLNFLFTRTQEPELASFDSLRIYLNSVVSPLLGSYSISNSSFEHMAYCGAISTEMLRQHPLYDYFWRVYPGLFCCGFTEELLGNASPVSNKLRPYLITCLHDPSKLQFRALNDLVLTQFCKEVGIIAEESKTFIELQNNHRLPDDRMRTFLSELLPAFQRFWDSWGSSRFQNSTPTNVGIAIATANIRRVTPKKMDLKDWVTD